MTCDITRGGKWYLENCRSRKLFIQSRNLGMAFVMSLKVSFCEFLFELFAVKFSASRHLGESRIYHSPPRSMAHTCLYKQNFSNVPLLLALKSYYFLHPSRFRGIPLSSHLLNTGLAQPKLSNKVLTVAGAVMKDSDIRPCLADV